MSRKEYMYAIAALLTCMVLGVLLTVLWVILFIPVMVAPKAFPDPRERLMGPISAAMTKRAMRSMMGGQNMPKMTP